MSLVVAKAKSDFPLWLVLQYVNENGKELIVKIKIVISCRLKVGTPHHATIDQSAKQTVNQIA